MTDLIEAHRSPLAGWVIAQCQGLTLIGKPSAIERLVAVATNSDGKALGFSKREARGLSPVFEVKPQLMQQGQGMTTVHVCVPLWLLAIDEIELPAGCIEFPCDGLSRAEQAGLAARVRDAEKLLMQMRAAAAGVMLAKEMPKERQG